MKRFISMLILLLMIVSLVIPISNINNQHKNDVSEPVLLSDITYEIVFEDVIEEPDA